MCAPNADRPAPAAAPGQPAPTPGPCPRSPPPIATCAVVNVLAGGRTGRAGKPEVPRGGCYLITRMAIRWRAAHLIRLSPITSSIEPPYLENAPAHRPPSSLPNHHTVASRHPRICGPHHWAPPPQHASLITFFCGGPAPPSSFRRAHTNTYPRPHVRLREPVTPRAPPEMAKADPVKAARRIANEVRPIHRRHRRACPLRTSRPTSGDRRHLGEC